MARCVLLDGVVAGFAAGQHGAFTLRQLGDACSHRQAAGRVRDGEWVRFARGTYVLARSVDRWSELAALCLHVPAAAITRASAAEWWQFDGVVGRRASLTSPGAAVVPFDCGTHRPGLRRCRDLEPWEVVTERGGCLRFTDPTRTLIELGHSVSPDVLERAIESAFRQRLTSLPRLRVRAEQLRVQGRSGPGAVLRVLAARPQGGGADSDGEVLLLQLLRDAGLAPTSRQHRVGRWRFDLAWPELRLAVELDGSHHRDPARLALDDRKQNEAMLAGWLVLRFTWDRIVGEPRRVVEEVRAALVARAVL